MTSWLDPHGRHEYWDPNGQSEFIFGSILVVCLSFQGGAKKMPQRKLERKPGSVSPSELLFKLPNFINHGNKEELF